MGNMIAQLISVASIPIITRLYSPESYGLFAIFFSIMMIITPLSTFHYHTAIMLPDSRSKAENLVVLSIMGVLINTIILSFVVAFIPNQWLVLIDAEGIDKILWLLPLAIFSQGVVLTFSFWVVRIKNYREAALSRIIESGTDRIVGISTGLMHFGVLGLILGRIIGSIISIAYLFIGKSKSEIRISKKNVSVTNVIEMAKRYHHFPKYSIWATLFNVVSRESPILLLALLFSSEITGMFALAMRVINMPMVMVGDALSKVYFQRASEARTSDQSIEKVNLQLVKYMLYCGAPPIIFLMCFSADIFEFIFGKDWGEAGIYTQILGLSFLAMFVQRPLASLFDVFEKQKAKLLFSILLFSARTGAVIIGAIIYNSPIISIILLSAVTFIMYFICSVYLLYLSGIKLWRFIIDLSHVPVILSISIIGLPLIKYFLVDTISVALLLAFVLLMIQGSIIIIKDPYLKKQFYKMRHKFV